MARLQILELPEGSDDDRPPFVLVIDQAPADLAGFDALRRDLGDHEDFLKRTGARAVLVFEETIDIPANDTTAYLRDSLPPDAHYETVIGGRPVEWTHVSEGQRLADERTGIARDMDRLAHRREELADALGLSPNLNWDDIRDTAVGIRKQRDAQEDELEQLRAGEEPVTDSSIRPTPAQWIWQWNRATPEKRLSMAAQILDGMPRANNCLMADHEAMIEALRVEVTQLRDGSTKPDA
ncbi:hypothetical protein [Streptomyces sp. NPDC001652]|uniref:hypothetical protein n=1 Tax=Streptomyces sp. NPDC001652 TaxID=3154393 RepID=UPI00333185B5